MSMNASFVQVEDFELSRIKADPSLAEPLFEGDTVMPPAFIALTKTMQDRLRTAGPKLLADALTRLDPAMRKQLEDRLGKPASVFAAGAPSRSAAGGRTRCSRPGWQAAALPPSGLPVSRRRPGSTSAPSRRKRSRCRYWPKSPSNADEGSAPAIFLKGVEDIPCR